MRYDRSDISDVFFRKDTSNWLCDNDGTTNETVNKDQNIELCSHVK